jgi:gliding motility-associated-like protein
MNIKTTNHFIMKWLILFFLIVSYNGISQEICNNGIDDDANGLIDLNDTLGCPCTLDFEQVNSLFQNPSFEDYIYCPNSFSQMIVVLDWVGATNGTSDYLNTCGFIYNAGNSGLLPFPDGNGAVGTIFTNTNKEYIGTCLNSPLLAGVNYTLKFYIASSFVHNTNGTCNQNIEGLFSPVDVTLFGAASCSSLPSPTFLCPTVGDSLWMEIASLTYTPLQSWNLVEINFTPLVNLETVMLGPPCNLPIEYVESQTCMPYIYFDNLILNTSNSFNNSLDTISSSQCTISQILTAQFSSPLEADHVVQWYKNGIAIIGQNNISYTVPANESGFGTYVVTLITSLGCTLSDSFVVNSLPETPIASFSGITQPSYQNGETIELTNTSSNFLDHIWVLCGDTLNIDEPIALTFAELGSCCIKLIATNNQCISIEEQCIEVVEDVKILIPNIFTPNNDLINDTFTIVSSGIKSLNCGIFNRWGTKIFQWENNVAGFWDGTENKNNSVSGTYYYIISYVDNNNQIATQKGQFLLLRD